MNDEEHVDLWDRIMEGDGQSDAVSYWDKADIDRMVANRCPEGFLPHEGNGGFGLTGIVSVTTQDAIEEAREAYRASEF